MATVKTCHQPHDASACMFSHICLSSPARPVVKDLVWVGCIVTGFKHPCGCSSLAATPDWTWKTSRLSFIQNYVQLATDAPLLCR